MTQHTHLQDRDEWLQQARALRTGQRARDALSVLAQMQAAHPGFSRLYQERGHCLILLGDAPAAMAALREAVRLNPSLPQSWDMLERLYRMAGDEAQAMWAAQQLAILQHLPPPLVVAGSLLADGDLEPAETVARGYLREESGNVGALRLLSRIRLAAGAADEAETLLAAALERAPDYHAARFDYGMALLQQQKHVLVREQAAHLLRLEPENRDYLKLYGASSVGLGDYEPLIALYEKLLKDRRDPDAAQPGAAQPDAEIADLRLWRANALKITGRAQEAIADYYAAIAARPESGAPWFALANLKTYRFSEDDIARMQATEGHPDLQDMDRVYLRFALGKAFEDRYDYAASWLWYEVGNALRAKSARYRPEVAEACVSRLKQVFTADFLAERKGWGVDDPSPIFVLGLPRSGSTLIEQILASHSQVEGTQELTLIGRLARDLCGQDPDCGLPLHPQALQNLTPDQARRLGERYLDDSRAYRRLDRPFFIDKMPNNVWHIGLIRLILPRARIIDVRREPMSCCFSNFKQLFGMSNQEFSYGLTHLARYYRAYLDLMRHWEAVAQPEGSTPVVLRVHYEDLVDDLEAGVGRMLAYCGLADEPGCIAFHETRRSVRTPSSEQVRQPIFRDGVEQWKPFAPWLGPLRDALGDAVTRYRS